MTVTDTTSGITVDPTADRLVALEAKIDLLTEQLSIVTAEAELRRRQREAIDDLTSDLGRVSTEAMAVATRELESLSETADLADAARLLRRLVEVAPALDRALVGLAAATELVDDMAPMGVDVVTSLTDRLAEAERKGYFEFARAAGGVADRVVANFDEDDLEQLGNNVVTILETVKEITQPEMLDMLHRMVGAVDAERRAVELEGDEPPSLWALLKQARDPDVRRGMARALHTLRTVSLETGPRPTRAGAAESHPTTPTQGETK